MQILGVRRLINEDNKVLGYSIVTDEWSNTVKAASRYDISIVNCKRYSFKRTNGRDITDEVMYLNKHTNTYYSESEGKYKVYSNVSITDVLKLFKSDKGNKVLILEDGVVLFKQEEQGKSQVVGTCTCDSVDNTFNITYTNNNSIKDDKSQDKSVKISSKEVVKALNKLLSVSNDSIYLKEVNTVPSEDIIPLNNEDSDVDLVDNIEGVDKVEDSDVLSDVDLVDNIEGVDKVEDSDVLSNIFKSSHKSVLGLMHKVSMFFSAKLSRYFKLVLSKQQDTTDEIKSLKAEIEALRGIINNIPTEKEYVEVVKERLVEIPVKEVIRDVEVVDNTKDYTQDINDINTSLGYIMDLVKDINNAPTSIPVPTQTIEKVVVVEGGSNLKSKDRRVTTKEFLYLLKDLNETIGNKWDAIGYKIYTEHKDILDRAEALGNYSVITIPEKGRYKGIETVDGDKLRKMMKKYDVHMEDAID